MLKSALSAVSFSARMDTRTILQNKRGTVSDDAKVFSLRGTKLITVRVLKLHPAQFFLFYAAESYEPRNFALDRRCTLEFLFNFLRGSFLNFHGYIVRR